MTEQKEKTADEGPLKLTDEHMQILGDEAVKFIMFLQKQCDEQSDRLMARASWRQTLEMLALAAIALLCAVGIALVFHFLDPDRSMPYLVALVGCASFLAGFFFNGALQIRAMDRPKKKNARHQ
jgi:hypothetical protein